MNTHTKNKHDHFQHIVTMETITTEDMLKESSRMRSQYPPEPTKVFVQQHVPSNAQEARSNMFHHMKQDTLQRTNSHMQRVPFVTLDMLVSLHTYSWCSFY